MSNFLVLDSIQQGTDEWRAWRRKVIGSSDAATIMGENPWSEIGYLAQEKMGLVKEFKGNAVTREGQAFEGLARAKASEYLGLKFDATIIQDSNYPYLAASLDGISEDYSSILEIKSGVKSHSYTAKTGQIPDYYYAQLQHMLMISDFESLYYVSFRPNEKLIVLEVGRDQEYIDILLNRELEFVKLLKKRGHIMQDKLLGKEI